MTRISMCIDGEQQDFFCSTDFFFHGGDANHWYPYIYKTGLKFKDMNYLASVYYENQFLFCLVEYFYSLQKKNKLTKKEQEEGTHKYSEFLEKVEKTKTGNFEIQRENNFIIIAMMPD